MRHPRGDPAASARSRLPEQQTRPADAAKEHTAAPDHAWLFGIQARSRQTAEKRTTPIREPAEQRSERLTGTGSETSKHRTRAEKTSICCASSPWTRPAPPGLFAHPCASKRRRHSQKAGCSDFDRLIRGGPHGRNPSRAGAQSRNGCCPGDADRRDTMSASPSPRHSRM